jgi:hypothetical protein
MKPRSVEEWEKIFADLPSPHTETAEQSIARRIIGDLMGYRVTRSQPIDVANVAHAIQAYARMMQAHGVNA